MSQILPASSSGYCSRAERRSHYSNANGAKREREPCQELMTATRGSDGPQLTRVVSRYRTRAYVLHRAVQSGLNARRGKYPGRCLLEVNINTSRLPRLPRLPSSAFSTSSTSATSSTSFHNLLNSLTISQTFYAIRHFHRLSATLPSLSLSPSSLVFNNYTNAGCVDFRFSNIFTRIIWSSVPYGAYIASLRLSWACYSLLHKLCCS